MARIALLLAAWCWSSCVADESYICKKLGENYNMFVDMVPFILPITFPQENNYFTGKAEILFMPADTPSCTLFQQSGDVRLLRLDVGIGMSILNNGKRMQIDRCQLKIHLRIEQGPDELVVRPILVDVSLLGNVWQDSRKIDTDEAEEILRPVLIKGLSQLAERHMSYTGARSSALQLDPAMAAALLKQNFLLFMAQL